MLHLRARLRASERGATATEYALLVVAIALIMVVGAATLGGAIRAQFENVSDCVSGVTTPDQCPAP